MKQIYSKDSDRTNNLSLTPGGSVVSVYYTDNTVIHYDKIKNVKKYVNAINKANVNRIVCNTETLYQK
jgi:hypothetical protein